MPKLTLDTETLKGIIFEDLDDWELIRDEMQDKDDWNIYYEVICKHIPTGKLYWFYYGRGATEYQDEGPEFATTEVFEVEPREVTVTQYVRVKDD